MTKTTDKADEAATAAQANEGGAQTAAPAKADPAAEHEAREARRAANVKAYQDAAPEDREAVARSIFDDDAQDLATIAADLRANGSSLGAVLRKAAHNAFGIVV